MLLETHLLPVAISHQLAAKRRRVCENAPKFNQSHDIRQLANHLNTLDALILNSQKYLYVMKIHLCRHCNIYRQV